jgi:anti-sigma-K factor RskA
MMDERREEQAALHVLGALSEAEANEFKQAMEADAELKQFVARLTTASGALAGAVTMAEPPPQLRAKILAQVGERQKTITLPERQTGFLNWLPWAFAAGLAVLCLGLFAQDTRLRQQVSTQENQITSLTALARTLQLATNDLQQAVLALQATNRLASLKIAMLNSLLADEPTAVAVTLWDDSKQEGVFVVQHLKALPADKDYQLWVMDNGTTPVNAGVFRVDANGGVRVDFKTRKPIKVAGKFAVTEEALGGVTAPTLKNMVLVGG